MEEELTSLYDDKELETKIKEAESKIREDLSRELLQNSLKLSKEEKKRKSGCGTLAGLTALLIFALELTTFQYFPNSQKAFYKGQFTKSYIYWKARGYYGQIKEDSATAWLAVYQGIKLKLVGQGK